MAVRRNWLLFLSILFLSALGALVGSHFGALELFEHQHNQFFEADPNRVVYNSTQLLGPYQRARLHPLHVLFLAPFGSLLAGRLGSPETITCVLTALFAGGVLVNVNAILERRLALSSLDRTLIVLFLGLSASQVTFTAIPDTHMLSAFGLSGLAREVSSGPADAPRNFLAFWKSKQGVRTLFWAVFAVGMLATSFVLVAWFSWVRTASESSSFRRRTMQAAASAFLVLGIVCGLHGIQQLLWPEPRSAEQALADDLARMERAHDQARQNRHTFQREWLPSIETYVPREPFPLPESVDPGLGKVERISKYVRDQIKYNAGYLTHPTELPPRLAQLLLALFVNDFYAPRFHVVRRWYPPWTIATTSTFEPWALSFRPTGALGASLWLGLLGFLGLDRLRTRTSGVNWGARTSAPPNAPENTDRRALDRYLLGVIGFYGLIVWLYGDELFLYSTNWAFALVLLFAGLYRDTLERLGQRGRAALRWVSATAIVCLAHNTSEHLIDLLHLYS